MYIMIISLIQLNLVSHHQLHVQYTGIFIIPTDSHHIPLIGPMYLTQLAPRGPKQLENSEGWFLRPEKTKGYETEQK